MFKRKLFLLVFVVAHAWLLVGRELLDGIVATVGSQPIFHSDIDEKIQGENPVLISDYPAQKNDDLRLRALQDAINSSLVFIECERMGLEVKEEQVTQQIEGIAQRNKLTVEALKGVLKQQNKNYANFRADIKKQLLLVLFQRRVIMPLITVKEKEVEDFYLKNKGETTDSLELSTKKIVLAIDSDSPLAFIEEKEKKINDIYSKLKGNLAFDEAVKLYSADFSQDATIMTYSFQELAPALQRAFSGLKKGEFTKPIRLPSGFYIFYLVERKNTKSTAFVDNKAQIKMELQYAKMEKTLTQWLEKKREETKVQLMAVEKKEKGAGGKPQQKKIKTKTAPKVSDRK